MQGQGFSANNLIYVTTLNAARQNHRIGLNQRLYVVFLPEILRGRGLQPWRAHAAEHNAGQMAPKLC